MLVPNRRRRRKTLVQMTFRADTCGLSKGATCVLQYQQQVCRGLAQQPHHIVELYPPWPLGVLLDPCCPLRATVEANHAEPPRPYLLNL